MAPVYLGEDVAQFGERRLWRDVTAGNDARVYESLARLVEAADGALAALGGRDDDDALLGGGLQGGDNVLPENVAKI